MVLRLLLLPLMRRLWNIDLWRRSRRRREFSRP
jgi:hypothetical protein